MAAGPDISLLLTIEKGLGIRGYCCRCSICGKKLKFDRINEYPLSCCNCMVVNAD